MPQSLTLDGLRDHLDKRLDEHIKRFDRLEKSLAVTDATVTALYAKLVTDQPNLPQRLGTIEHNLQKLIELTPGAGELRQPVYAPGLDD
jgi:hypothetical protein